MFLAALAAACMAGMPNLHPHAIRNSDDAIATAYADWAASIAKAGMPTGAGELAHWKRLYTAQRKGSAWHLIPHPLGARYRGQGIQFWIDGKTGCTISETSFD